MRAVPTTAEISDELPGRIDVEIDYRLKETLERVPGAKWTSRKWTVPLSWPVCLALRAEFGEHLTIGPRLRAWAKDEGARKKFLREYRSAIEPTYDFVSTADPSAADALFPYQKTGGQLISIAGSYIICDETGTGKSRTAPAGLAALAANGPAEDPTSVIFPLLIVAPKSVVINWTREVAAFFPGADIRACVGTPAKIRAALEPGGDVYVINWDALKKYSRVAYWGGLKKGLTEEEKTDKEIQALGIKSVIADEAHRAKNPASIQTRALWAAGAKAPFKIMLTGSPIQDTLEDMWALLHFVAPHEYPTKTAYVERYLDITWNQWGGREIRGVLPARQEEFFSNLDARMRRITKEVALPFLPEKVYEIRWVTLPPKLKKAYDSMVNDMVAELESGMVLSANSVLERAGRLVQLANSSGEMVPPDPSDPDGKPRFRMDFPSPKLDAFMEDVKNGDFEGHQVVIYSDSRQLADMLAETFEKTKGITFGVVNGSTDADERQRAMDAFQAGALQYIIITRAGAEGITLTAADIMVRLMRPWSYIVYTQSEDRVHRIGSEIHESVTIIDYITESTVEVAQLVRLKGKEARAQEVLRDSELLAMIKS